MKNRIRKFFAFMLAVLLIVGCAPTPASAALAASVCEHENATTFITYTYEYMRAYGSHHRVYRYGWYSCPDCNEPVIKDTYVTLEPHTFGTAVWTGNHYHSGKLHIYETVSTCVSCKFPKYSEVSAVCNGNGVNCPIIMS